MSTWRYRLTQVACALVIASAAPAQQRPKEEDLFGKVPEREAPKPPTPTPEQKEGASRDERALSGAPTTDVFAAEPSRDNPLTIGGQIYLRSLVQGSEGQSLDQARFLMPAIVDGYFDARPNDRVRGMILGRLTYDPTLSQSGGSTAFGSGSSTGDSGFTLPRTSNPGVLLDQLWVNFDIARTVFVTAGRQHVKWGVSRFWNPTDFLSPQRRDPLAIFDPRLGASMIKLHLPSEAHGWNLYGIGLVDNAGPASTLGQLGGAFRGEIAFGRSEVGAEVVLQPNRKGRFGFDGSSALGPLDVYVEVSLRKGVDGNLWRINPNADPVLGYLGQFTPYKPTDLSVGASGGFNTTLVFGDNNNLIVGAEYFYNSVGYDSEAYYPWLIYQGAFQPFYLGRHYGALYAVFTSPPLLGENTSLNLSNLSNLSDRSLITRLDMLTRVLSYLYVEAYADVHYGRHGGEFRFEVKLPPQQVGGFALPVIPAALFDAGLGVRIKI